MNSVLRRCAAGLAAALLLTMAIVINSGASAQAAAVRVMPLGDSITDGFNVPGGYRIDLWQKVVAGGYSVDFVGSLTNGPASLGDRNHEGHSGWRIDQLDANINSWMRSYPPRTVLLHIGTNDIIQNRDLANAPNRLAALIDKISAASPDTKVFVASIVPANNSGINHQIRSFNAAIPQIVRTRADAGRPVYFVDMFAALNTGDLADTVHPNASGYSKMATAWYNALLAVPGSLTDGTTPTTPPPTTPPPATPPPGGAGCTATISLNSWNGGFVATVRVTAGSAGTNGWTVGMTLPSGATISNAWNADRSGNSGAVQFTNVSYNGRIAAGQSTEFGFQSGGSGSGMTPTCTAS